jgi:hypothetical protein
LLRVAGQARIKQRNDRRDYGSSIQGWRSRVKAKERRCVSQCQAVKYVVMRVAAPESCASNAALPCTTPHSARPSAFTRDGTFETLDGHDRSLKKCLD